MVITFRRINGRACQLARGKSSIFWRHQCVPVSLQNPLAKKYAPKSPHMTTQLYLSLFNLNFSEILSLFFFSFPSNHNGAHLHSTWATFTLHLPYCSVHHDCSFDLDWFESKAFWFFESGTVLFLLELLTNSCDFFHFHSVGHALTGSKEWRFNGINYFRINEKTKQLGPIHNLTHSEDFLLAFLKV